MATTRIRALNADCSNDSTDTESPLITKEAEESAAYNEYKKALEKIACGDKEEALRCLHLLLNNPYLKGNSSSDDPSNLPQTAKSLKYSCFKNLGHIYSDLGNIESGLNYLLKAVEMNGEDTLLWYYIGKLASKMTNLNLASYCFYEALKLSPSHWPSIDGLILVLYLGNDDFDCLRHISEAFKKDPLYLYGHVIRDRIFEQRPSILKDLCILKDIDLKFGLLQYDREKLWREMDRIEKLYKEKREKHQIVFPPEKYKAPICLVKPLQSFTWLSLGNSLLHLYHYIDEDLELDDFHCPIDMLNVSCVESSRSKFELKNDDEEEEAAVFDSTSDNNDAKAKKRRRNSASYLELWMWGGQRRSARVRSTLRREADRDDGGIGNVADAVRGLIPAYLLPGNLHDEGSKLSEQTTMNEDSMNTMDMYYMFEKMDRSEDKRNEGLSEHEKSVKLSSREVYFHVAKRCSEVNVQDLISESEYCKSVSLDVGMEYTVAREMESGSRMMIKTEADDLTNNDWEIFSEIHVNSGKMKHPEEDTCSDPVLNSEKSDLSDCETEHMASKKETEKNEIGCLERLKDQNSCASESCDKTEINKSQQEGDDIAETEHRSSDTGKTGCESSDIQDKNETENIQISDKSAGEIDAGFHSSGIKLRKEVIETGINESDSEQCGGNSLSDSEGIDKQSGNNEIGNTKSKESCLDKGNGTLDASKNSDIPLSGTGKSDKKLEEDTCKTENAGNKTALNSGKENEESVVEEETMKHGEKECEEINKNETVEIEISNMSPHLDESKDIATKIKEKQDVKKGSEEHISECISSESKEENVDQKPAQSLHVSGAGDDAIFKSPRSVEAFVETNDGEIIIDLTSDTEVENTSGTSSVSNTKQSGDNNAHPECDPSNKTEQMEVDEDNTEAFSKECKLNDKASQLENEKDPLSGLKRGCCVETCDVREYMLINSNKHTIIRLLEKILFILSTKWNLTWPEGLVPVFLDVFQYVKEHTQYDRYINDNYLLEHYELFRAKMCSLLVFGELLLDKLFKMKIEGRNENCQEKINKVNVALGEMYGVIKEKNVFGEGHNIFVIRLMWLQSKMYLFQGESNRTVSVLEVIKDYIEDGVKIILPNVRYHNKISRKTLKRLCLTLERNEIIRTVLPLYEQQKYEEVAEILKGTFNHSRHIKEFVTLPEHSPDLSRHSQLKMLLECLWYLDKIEECFVWGEACLNEALNKYLNCDEQEQTVWMVTTKSLLIGLEKMVGRGGMIIVGALEPLKLSRLVQNLITIMCQQLDAPPHIIEIPFETVIPWILLQKILQFEYQRKEYQDITFTEVPSHIEILFVSHDLLSRRSWCCCDEGALLIYAMSVIIPKTKDPRWRLVRDRLCQGLEQIFYCLYLHPNKKPKGRQLQEHGVSQIPLDWRRAKQIFNFYSPNLLPEFDSNHAPSISADCEVLFRRIINLVPDSCNPAETVEKMNAYIYGKAANIPVLGEASTRFPRQISCIYYLLGDYYFKNNEWSKAIHHYLLDVCLNPVRLDSWAGMALARGSQLETKLNSCEKLTNESEFVKEANAAVRCFQRATDIDSKHSVLWIEYGSFVYMIHSFCSRTLKQSTNLSLEMWNNLDENKDDMLNTAIRCFVNANKVWSTIGEEQGLQDERWLHHYMLGKVAEKQDPQPNNALKHYSKALNFLIQNKAVFTMKVSYTNPQNLAIESIEVVYRIHSAILKFLKKNEGTSISNDLRSTFQSYIDLVKESPFMTFCYGENDTESKKRRLSVDNKPEIAIKRHKVQQTSSPANIDSNGNSKDSKINEELVTVEKVEATNDLKSCEAVQEDSYSFHSVSTVEIVPKVNPIMNDDDASTICLGNRSDNAGNDNADNKEKINCEKEVQIMDGKSVDTIKVEATDSSEEVTVEYRVQSKDAKQFTASDIPATKVTVCDKATEELESDVKSNANATQVKSINSFDEQSPEEEKIIIDNTVVESDSSPNFETPSTYNSYNKSENNMAELSEHITDGLDKHILERDSICEDIVDEGGKSVSEKNVKEPIHGKVSDSKNCDLENEELLEDDKEKESEKQKSEATASDGGIKSSDTSPESDSSSSAGENSSDESSSTSSKSSGESSSNSNSSSSSSSSSDEEENSSNTGVESGEEMELGTKEKKKCKKKKRKKRKENKEHDTAVKEKKGEDLGKETEESESEESDDSASGGDRLGDENNNRSEDEESDSSSDGSSGSSQSSSSEESSNSEAEVNVAKENNADGVIDNSDLVKQCVVMLEECALRFPQHYKSIYQMASLYHHSKLYKDSSKCHSLLLDTYSCEALPGRPADTKIPGLFADRRSHNIFNGVWRIPVNEIDRPGSFSTHMNLCMVLLTEVLREELDHKLLLELAILLKKIPDPDKKYLRDSDREQLSRQAFTLCQQSIRKSLELCKTSKGKSLPLLRDVYASYQRVQKHFPNKEQQFSNLLLECYKVHFQVENATISSVVRFCQMQALLAVRHPKLKSNTESSTTQTPTTQESGLSSSVSTSVNTSGNPTPVAPRPRGRPPGSTNKDKDKSLSSYNTPVSGDLSKQYPLSPYYMYPDQAALQSLRQSKNLPRLDEQIAAFNMLNYQAQMSVYQAEFLRHFASTSPGMFAPPYGPGLVGQNFPPSVSNYSSYLMNHPTSAVKTTSQDTLCVSTSSSATPKVSSKSDVKTTSPSLQQKLLATSQAFSRAMAHSSAVTTTSGTTTAASIMASPSVTDYMKQFNPGYKSQKHGSSAQNQKSNRSNKRDRQVSPAAAYPSSSSQVSAGVKRANSSGYGSRSEKRGKHKESSGWSRELKSQDVFKNFLQNYQNSLLNQGSAMGMNEYISSMYGISNPLASRGGTPGSSSSHNVSMESLAASTAGTPATTPPIIHPDQKMPSVSPDSVKSHKSL